MQPSIGDIDSDIREFAEKEAPGNPAKVLWIARSLYATRTRVRHYADMVRRREAANREAIQQLVDELDRTRSYCSHAMTKRHPDPSGNNDSWRECLICGATI